MMATARSAERLWAREVWDKFRPFLIALSVDALIAISVWVMLWLVQAAAKLLPVSGWVADFVIGFHETMAVLNLLLFGLFAVRDLYRVKKDGESRRGGNG